MRNILVTGTGATGCGASIVHALKQAGSWGIVAADVNPFSWGLHAADHGVLIRYPDDPFYLEQLQYVIEYYQVAAVIPGTEPDLVFLSEHRDKLPVPLIANRAGLLPLMRDKHLAAEKLYELGLSYVKSYAWHERDKAWTEFGFPLVVKPMRNTSGSRGLHLVMNQRELDSLAQAIPYENAPYVQPYIGDDQNEYTVGVMSRSDGTVIDSIVIRRELSGLSLLAEKVKGRRYAISSGFTQGYVIRHRLIQDFCEQLAVRLGSTGPLNIQLRLHTGEPYVFEIHPRFSGSTGIRASAGFNEPDTMLRHFLDGENFTRFDYQVGVAAIRYLDHILVPMEEMHAAG